MATAAFLLATCEAELGSVIDDQLVSALLDCSSASRARDEVRPVAWG